jgi:hypothetical protein
LLRNFSGIDELRISKLATGKEMPFPPGVGGRGIGAGRGSDMPFPPGVGGSTAIEGGVGAKSVVMAGPESHSFEVITAEKALDENNRGNRMLRNMGWQEGLVCPSVNLFLLEIEREREL